ncbi:MAG: hypothetical protein AAFQ51_13690, partial [Pseudomonadota bacterium]
IVGSTLDPSMEGALRVSVVATGIDAEEQAVAPPKVTPLAVEEPVAEAPAPVEPVEAAPVLAAAPEPEPQPTLTEVTPDDAFITPRAAVPGEPSEDTMRRLHAAVAKQPERESMAPPRVVAETPEREAPDADADDRGRFAINSLIHRMTGTAEREQPPAPRAQTPSEDLDEAERARIEIPAFLRRQAN